MKFTVTPLPHSLLEITIQLDKNDLLPYKEKALQELGKNLTIKGFRPGKAPLDIVEKNLSPLEIGEKTIFLALQKIYPQIIQDNQIEAIGSPEIHLTKLIPLQEAEIKIKTAVIPQFELPDIPALIKDIPHSKVDVQEQEITDALEWLRKSKAQYQPAHKNSAEPSNIVTIDYILQDKTTKDKKKKVTGYSFVLGKGSFPPALEKQIIGMKVQETKTFSETLPDDWPDKEWKGKKIQAQVTLREIKELHLPKLDDKFAQSVGKFANLEELKKSIAEGLRREKEQKAKERWRIQALEKIAQHINLEIPQILIEAELEKMIAELKDRIQELQLTWEEYLKQIKKTEEEIKQNFLQTAEKRVKNSLILRKIATEKKIEVSPEEIEQKANEILTHIFDPSIKEKINPEDLRNFSASVLRNEKVFQFLEELSQEQKE